MWVLLVFILVVAVVLRLIVGPSARRHIIAISLGVLVGLYLAFCELWVGSPARIFDIIESPVFGLEWMLEHVFGFPVEKAMPCFFLFHFVFWAFVGGGIFLGVAVLWAKMRGDEDDA
jgi:hypothetical protein